MPTADETQNMDANAEPKLTKLTAKIFPPVLWAFDRQINDALLRRDAFLDRVFAQEIEHIREDLKGLRNSDAAKRHISRCLNVMGGAATPKLQAVSIAMRETTADALRAVVEEHNLCRDALINWIIVLLRSTDALLKVLELPATVSSRWSAGMEDAPTSPMKMIESAQWDAFYYLREACRQRHGCGLYNLPLAPSMHGFQCHLDDEWVPTTAAFKAREARDAEMFSGLIDFEDRLEGIAVAGGGVRKEASHG